MPSKSITIWNCPFVQPYANVRRFFCFAHFFWDNSESMVMISFCNSVLTDPDTNPKMSKCNVSTYAYLGKIGNRKKLLQLAHQTCSQSLQCCIELCAVLNREHFLRTEQYVWVSEHHDFQIMSMNTLFKMRCSQYCQTKYMLMRAAVLQDQRSRQQKSYSSTWQSTCVTISKWDASMIRNQNYCLTVVCLCVLVKLETHISTDW